MNWEIIVQDFITKHSDQIRQTTQPLRDHLDVTYFTYHRIDTDGKYTVLVDRPDWAERYVSQKLYLEDPYLRHPDHYLSGMCAMLSNGTEAYRKELYEAGKEVIDAGHALFLVEKTSSSVEFFGFISKMGSNKLYDVACNRPVYLKAFAAHFKRTMKSVLQTMEEGASRLIELKGNDFYKDERVHTDPALNLVDYLKDIGLGNFVDFARSLSRQEKKCLFHLAEGKTAKEIALILHLSHRTVESYLEHAKNKMKVSSFELFDLAKDFKEFGLILKPL